MLDTVYQPALVSQAHPLPTKGLAKVMNTIKADPSLGRLSLDKDRLGHVTAFGVSKRISVSHHGSGRSSRPDVICMPHLSVRHS